MPNPRSPAPPSAPSAPAPPVPRKKFIRTLLKRVAIGGAGLLAILLIVFFLLPQWISDDQGRAYVLQQLNKRIDATLAVGSWSVGWFHGTTLTDVTITLPDGTPLLTCPAIHSELTLWGIIRGNYDVGTTTADGLHLRVTKGADGSNSFDALIGKTAADRAGLLRALRTLRGSVRAKAAEVTVSSDAAHESIDYTDVNFASTIASSDSPFHIELTAAERDGSVSLGATLPPIAGWSAQQPDSIVASSDFDLNAAHVPVGLLCDLLGLDPHWRDSFGAELVTLSLSNHPSPSDRAGKCSCQLSGSDSVSTLDVKMLLRSPTGASATLITLPPAASDSYFSADLKLSPPLARLLSRTNPAFAELKAGNGPLHLTLSDAAFFPDAPARSRASARITFPPLTFHRSGLIAQLLDQSPADEPASPSASADTIEASAAPLRLRLNDGRFTIEPFVLTFPRRQPITLQGSVSLTGEVQMLATIPSADAALGTAMIDIPITGTIDHPILTPPR